MLLKDEIMQRLYELQDEEYREFQCKLIPNVKPERVIGVRTPDMRRLAKEFSKREGIDAFLDELPHGTYEENNLHGFLIEQIKDYDTLVARLDSFLPFVDNWATCDLMSPKAFKKHLPELLLKIDEWLKSGDTYTVRFGIEMLMSFYLDEHFDAKNLSLVAAVQSDEYYVNMMVAWFFATALAKQYDSTLPFLTESRLSVWTHNKTIRKAIESYRITDEQKAFLRTLKR